MDKGKGNAVAIIPARGGSKGVKDKNIRMCAGKPLLYWVAEAARQSGVFDRIVVSTDSKKIAKVAEGMSLEVQMRPDHLSRDEVSVTQILPYVIRHLGQAYEYTAILEPTGPLVEALDIQRAFGFLKLRDAEMVISVCPTPAPLGFSAPLPSDDSLYQWLPREYKFKQRQDVSPAYMLDGNIYIAKTWIFDEQVDYWNTSVIAWRMPYSKYVDIDDEEDLKLAELKLERRLYGSWNQ